MAVVFKSVGAVDTVSASPVEPGAPSGVVSGDLLLMVINCQFDTVVVTTPTGWTLHGSRSYHSANGEIYIFWRKADGGGNDTPSVTLATVFEVSAVILRIDGQDDTTPIDVSDSVYDGSAPITHPDVTATSDDSLAIVAGGTFLDETGTYTFTNSFTERVGTTTNNAMWVGTKAVDSGAVGTTDVTNTSSLIRSGAWTIVIAPAAGGLTLTVQNLSQSQSIDNSTLLQANNLTPNDLGQSQVLDNGVLSQAQLLIVAEMSQGQILDNAGITQANNIAPNDLGQSQTLDSPGLTQKGNLVVQELGQSQTLETPALTQKGNLVVQDLGQSQAIDNVILSLASSIVVQDLAQAQTLDNVGLSTAGSIIVQALTQAQTLETPSLTQAGNLVIQGLTHAQIIDAVNLAQANNLTVNSLTQAQLIEATSLTQHYALAIQGIVQSQNIDNVSITSMAALTVAGLSQSQIIDTLALTQANVLTVQDLTQQQLIDILSLDTGIAVLRNLVGEVFIASVFDNEIVLTPIFKSDITLH